LTGVVLHDELWLDLLEHFWRKFLHFVIPAKAEALFNSAKRSSIQGLAFE
jgi:hypothetical protein